MSPIKKWLHLLWLPFASLSIAFTTTILLSPLIYSVFIQFGKWHQLVGLSIDQLKEDFLVLYYYLLNPFKDQLAFNYFSSSQNGLQHFHEVKQLMQVNFLLSLLSIFLIIYFINSKSPKWYKGQLKRLIGWLIYLPMASLFFVVIAFEQLFLLFHQLFFRNDLWLFNPLTDPIIYVLPQSLFLICFLLIIVIYELIIIMIKQLI